MPDRSYFEAEDFADREPAIERLAQLYVEAYPTYDIVTARQIVDSHPTTQALLGREPAGDLLTAPAPGDVPTPSTKVGEYEWQGEVLELSPQVGYALLAEYRTAAAALHAAKEAAKTIEAKIMETLGGYEHGSVDGQQLFHWPIVNSTSFNAKAFKEDPERKALYDAFLVTKQTRRFKVDGTVGVD